MRLLPLFNVLQCNGPQNLYLIITGPKADQTTPNWPHRAGQVQCLSGQRALQGEEGGQPGSLLIALYLFHPPLGLQA